MASLYRPVVTRYLNRDGQQVAKGTAGARRVRERSQTWRGRYRGADGTIRTVSLSDDRNLAETMLADISQRVKRERAGDVDPFEDHRKRPLTEHLDDFAAALLAKEATDKQVGQVTARCRKIIDACRFKLLADLSPSAVANYLRERRQAGLGRPPATATCQASSRSATGWCGIGGCRRTRWRTCKSSMTVSMSAMNAARCPPTNSLGSSQRPSGVWKPSGD